jgi:hypothetical protein
MGLSPGISYLGSTNVLLGLTPKPINGWKRILIKFHWMRATPVFTNKILNEWPFDAQKVK